MHCVAIYKTFSRTDNKNTLNSWRQRTATLLSITGLWPKLYTAKQINNNKPCFYHQLKLYSSSGKPHIGCTPAWPCLELSGKGQNSQLTWSCVRNLPAAGPQPTVWGLSLPTSRKAAQNLSDDTAFILHLQQQSYHQPVPTSAGREGTRSHRRQSSTRLRILKVFVPLCDFYPV